MPAAIELDPDVKPVVPKNTRQTRWMVALLLVVSIGFTVGAVHVGRTIGERNGVSARRKRLTKSILESDPQGILNPSDASFDRALQWISDIDPLQLAPNDTGLLQRFLVTHFYMAAAKDPWSFVGNTTECLWTAIICNAQGKVDGIDCSNLGLSGFIPESLALLSDLQRLTLRHNEFSGSIPANLPRTLKLLHFHNNSLTGSIPSTLLELTDLSNLNIVSNSITGSIPNNIGKLSLLSNVNLVSNVLEGTLQECLFRLSRLTSLHLEQNSISGSIYQAKLAICR